MKKFFKATIISLAGLLCFSLGSCSKGGAQEEDYYDPEHRPFGKYDEPVRVKGVMEFLPHNDSRVPSNITPETNVYIKKIKSEMNIQWEYLWKVPSTQYEQKLTSQMLSKTHPDILKLNAGQYEQFLKRGLLKDLTETYLYASDKTKAFLNRNPEVIENLKTSDGKIYAIPQYDDINREVPVMYYRKDWLDKNKLSVPTTPEELKNVLTVFKEKEGATSALGLSKSFVGSYLTLDRYLQTYGANPFSWIDVNGELVASEITDNSKNALKYLNSLYKAGLIAIDFASTDVAGAENAIKNEKTGVIFGPRWQYEYPLADILPSQDWACAPIPLAEGASIIIPKQQISYYYVCTKDFTHPEILMKMINAYIERDGIEGCKPEDGYVWSWVPTQFYDPNEVDTQYHQFQERIKTDPEASQPAPEEWSNHLKNLWKVYPQYKKWKEDHGSEKYKANRFANILGRLTDEGAWKAILDTRESGRVIFEQYYDLPTQSQKDFGGQMSTHVNQYFIAAIMGNVDIDKTWDSYVAEWKSLGGSKCTAEVNEWYKTHK
ncbi:MAG: extracellular solute-binding protein [Candidatus Onthovivens sp.]|nr:extracellular solute-binding protein [Candidatus Onthovivens sp.]